MNTRDRICGGAIVAVLLLLTLAARAAPPPAAAPSTSPLLTVAEKSDYHATSRYADVLAFCQELAKRSPLVRLGELGASGEGRKLPLLILADPPVASPEEAAKSGKRVLFAEGNIHAGEVDGKEALLMLARELALGSDGRSPSPILKSAIIVFAPILNADGNERLAKANRPGQNGPDEMGIRENSQGLDLNRDFTKLETPEVRALVRFVRRWDPAMVVDTHTTDGSYHRYLITYDRPRNPAAAPGLVAFTRDTLLPDITRRFEKSSPYRAFFYGNFEADHQEWVPYPPQPRYGVQYLGLRNCIGILSESYTHAPFRDRCLATRDFVRACLEAAAENRDRIRAVLAQAREASSRKGEPLALVQKMVPMPEPATILGWEDEQRNGRRVATDKPKDYRAWYLGASEPVVSVTKPYAYLFPARFTAAMENLQRHGIEVEELREDIDLDVDVYRVGPVAHAPPFQNHAITSVEVAARVESRRVPAGTILVRTGQPLGTLAAYLLEPRAEDGLGAWNFFDTGLAEGGDYPVMRLGSEVPLTSGRVRPLAEERPHDQPITVDLMERGQRPPNFAGSPITVADWLDDGQHFLQVKGGQLRKVDALTGRSEPFFDPAAMEKALAALPAIGAATAKTLAHLTSFEMNPQRTGALFTHEHDLYYATFDGSQARRLTTTPGDEEGPAFSPDGKFVAYTREHNLYVVEIATTGTERALTSDGSAVLSNGRPDWVYEEEIYGRGNPRCFWWSPDSSSLAFLQFDDRPVPPFTVTDPIPPHETVENTPYPRAGDPNPHVRLGLVAAGGESVRWVDTSDYTPDASLIVRVGWYPDSSKVYFYVQDRAQTWLDFCTAAGGGPPVVFGAGGGFRGRGRSPRSAGAAGPDAATRLFRERTKAWVEDPGEPHFLKDGSFLLFSERTGWKHLYHFSADGKDVKAVTSGDWEARNLEHVDEDQGWVYLTGTKDSPIAENLYRVKLDGTGLQRLTAASGNHRISFSPKGNLYVDTWSSHTQPSRVLLCRADGQPARTLDTNPVYAIEEYRWGKYELVHIPTPDRFTLEGSVLLPPDLDPSRKYPVWFKTYGGPHAPVVHDSWFDGEAGDQALAQQGFIVFSADPRSASGKGACSTWAAYKQLGVQECKDIETAIRWLCQRPYVDAARIGMSGHSYGGFMTAYCLTHSTLFAAGIAGAPVTDWRDYDSIYTERYMNTPQENPEGYDATSVVKAAENLHGKLLILHGLIDDNVHIQNTMQWVQALQAADKDFEMMVYPRSRHGVGGAHVQRLQLEFMERALGLPVTPREPRPDGDGRPSSGRRQPPGR